MTYGCQTEAIPDVTTVPSVSGLNILDSLDIKYQWLFTANAKECPCSDCREAREISSMERLYPDGRLPLSINDDVE